jgi:hypothetical protein
MATCGLSRRSASMLRLRCGSPLASLSLATPGRIRARAGGLTDMVTGEFVAADPAECSPGMLQIADVICTGGDRGKAQEWVSSALCRCPGGMVVAHGSASDCVVGVRGQPPFFFRAHVLGDLAMYPALLCASFAYGWLAAGWPITVRENADLELAADVEGPAARWRDVPGRGILLSFGISYPGNDP